MDAPAFFGRRVAVGSWHTTVTFLLVALTSPSAHGVTIRVPADQPTIRAGINAASAGDTVLVAPGTYAGPGNRDLSFGGTDLVLRSSGGPVMTVIDCQTQGRGFHFHGGETSASVVEGFTIRNGLASGTYGGAILIEAGATPTIRGCRFETNHANAGGGVYVVDASAVVRGCDFEGNTADNYGGGVYGRNASLQLAGCSFAESHAGIGAGTYVHGGSDLELVDSSFVENEALNLGGGLYASGSSLTLARCSFSLNTAKAGAGMYMIEGATATVDSCTFTANTADFGGGGMHAESPAVLTVTWCRFEANAVLMRNVQYHYGGGGVLCYQDPGATTDLHLADCQFIANRAQGEAVTGGGLRVELRHESSTDRCTFIDNHSDGYGGGATFHSGAVLAGCVFDNNDCGRSGGGLYGARELVDCRFVNNYAPENGGGAFLLSATTGGMVVRCGFSGNVAGAGGGLYKSWGGYPVTIVDSRFSDNVGGEGGGMRLYVDTSGALLNCVFERNMAFDGGAVKIARALTGLVTFSGCSLVRNHATVGGGLSASLPIAIENTIIAFGTEGEPVACADGAEATVACTDIYGNEGGDWTGCISDQLGINGNFSADPVFCNVGAGDYSLAETSPCAPEHSPAGCGLIGAFPVACVNPIGVAVEAVPPVAGRLRVTPNPIGPGSVIEWANVNAAPLNLRLYNPLGRLVTSRSLGLMPEGRQELRWDRLLGDRRLPPGVYLLELGGPSGGMDRARVVLIR